MLHQTKYLAFAFIAAVAAHAQAASDSVTRQIPVTDDFIEGKVGFTEGAGWFFYRINIISVNNVLEFCGVMAVTGVLARDFDSFLRDSAFEINGRKVVRDLRYWNRVDRKKLGQSVANCRSTGVKANSKIDSIGIAWSQRRYRL